MLVIRQVEPGDLEEIARIEAENFSPEEAASKAVLAERIAVIADTFWVAELEGRLAGYIEGPAIAVPYITDDLFRQSRVNPPSGGYLAVTSLSIASDFQGQGIGTALLAAFKDVAVAQKRLGITLTCHDILIPYYERNGFADHGLAESAHGGSVWYNMVWQSPQTDESGRP